MRVGVTQRKFAGGPRGRACGHYAASNQASCCMNWCRIAMFYFVNTELPLNNPLKDTIFNFLTLQSDAKCYDANDYAG